MKAYELLDSPEKWIKQFSAKNARGYPVLPDNEDAFCWCIAGAIEKCYSNNTMNLIAAERRLLDILKNKGYIGDRKDSSKPHSYIDWNDADGTTYDEVISVLKEANV